MASVPSPAGSMRGRCPRASTGTPVPGAEGVADDDGWSAIVVDRLAAAARAVRVVAKGAGGLAA